MGYVRALESTIQKGRSESTGDGKIKFRDGIYYTTTIALVAHTEQASQKKKKSGLNENFFSA